MTKPYFAMIYNQAGNLLIPMVDDKDDLKMYATLEEAAFAAGTTFYGEHFGYDIFCAGDGL